MIQKTMNPSSRFMIGLCALALLFSAPASAEEQVAPDLKPGPATIYGTVTTIEDPGVGVAGAKVVLYALNSDGSPGLQKTTTDDQGRFRFESISNAPSITYLLGAQYKNIPFPGARIVFTNGELEREVPIQVSNPIKDGSLVTLRELEIEVSLIGGDVSFTETYLIDNPGSRAVSVEAADRKGLRPPLVFELPESAAGFTMPFDMIPDGIEQKEGRIEFWGPIYSGPQDLSFSYSLPVSIEDKEKPGKLVFNKEFARRLPRVTVLIPADGPTFQALKDNTFIEDAPVERSHRLFRTFKTMEITQGETLSFELTVPAPNLDPSALTIQEVTFFLELDEALLDVREQYTVHVSGSRAATGNTETPLLNIPLPEGATDVRVGTGGRELGLIPSEDWSQIAVTGPIHPGESVLSLAYHLPRGGFAIDEPFHFQREFGKPVPVLSTLIADTYIAADSNLLHPLKSARLEDGRIHLFLEGFTIAAGEQVAIDITPLPARKSPSRALLMTTLIPVGFAGILFLMAPLKRTTRLELDPTETLPSETRRERDLVYSAIRDLEDDFDNGILSEQDYENFRTELRAKAIDLLQHEKEESENATQQAAEEASTDEPVAQATPFCSQCGSSLQAADQFCSQCGTASPPTDTPA